jgi:hypothetical protein
VRLLALVFMLCFVTSAPAFAQGVEDQVVRVHVSKKEVDRSSPWQFEEVQQQSYLGVVLGDGRILTTAFAVADAAFLEVQRFGSSRRVEAAVAFVDYEVNLALIQPGGPLPGTKAVAFGDDLAIDDAVEIYRTRDSYQLAKMPATLTEVGVFAAVTSSYSLVSYLLKVQQTALGWAEPVFRQGKLVALTTGQDQNFVHALPIGVIRHFLEDRHDQGYRGFPSIGVVLTSLTSPDTRKLLGAEGYEHGVRIGQVQLGSSFSELLQTDDVILEVEGIKISEHGFYTHPKWGKIHLKYLLNQRYGGDTLKLKILRAGKVVDLSGKLERFDSNATPVVAYRYGQPEPHVIFGGLIFEELSQPYLKQWGRDWRNLAPFELLYTLEYRNDQTTSPGDRVVFLTRVLADDFNRGYTDLKHQVVDQVNGVKITSIAKLREALAKPVLQDGKRYARIEFLRDGGDVVLAYDGLEAAHARIAKTYEVKTADSFATPPSP